MKWPEAAKLATAVGQKSLRGDAVLSQRMVDNIRRTWPNEARVSPRNEDAACTDRERIRWGDAPAVPAGIAPARRVVEGPGQCDEIELSRGLPRTS